MRKRIIAAVVRLRRRLPAWLDRALDRALASNRGPARFLKSRLAAGEKVPVPMLPAPDAAVRLLIGPYNYAGQGWQWARSVERPSEAQASVSARNLALANGKISFPADCTVPATVFLGSAEWHRALTDALGAYTHVLIESFGSLLGRGGGDALLAEIAELRRRGIAVALLCHGSDIRSPRAHSERNPDASIDHWGDGVERLERAAAAGADVIARFDGPVFVSTLDLVDDVPSGLWLPVVVDPAPWRAAAASDREPNEGAPSVLHVPSSAGMKGSQYIDPVCTALEAEGIIRFHSLRGIPADRMPTEVAAADIVVDQLLVGSYGVAACEAMAAGRVVVGNVSDAVRSRVRDETGYELPIVQATRADLEAVLRRLAAHPAERNAAAVAGRAFVEQVHAGTRTRSALAEFLAA